jgi:hypothetical protein
MAGLKPSESNLKSADPQTFRPPVKEWNCPSARLAGLPDMSGLRVSRELAVSATLGNLRSF